MSRVVEDSPQTIPRRRKGCLSNGALVGTLSTGRGQPDRDGGVDVPARRTRGCEAGARLAPDATMVPGQAGPARKAAPCLLGHHGGPAEEKGLADEVQLCRCL